VDDRKELTEEDIVSIVGKMIKQRKEAAEQYEKADRADLQNTELAEIEILKNYLPTQLTVEEVSVVINTIISETGASGMQDMGKVMGLAKAKIAGQADMSVVSQQVKALLSQTAS
ncbi:MAG: GatB/YqeY domain-containing protein, partial [Proteobacteria bacterium]|nr:GatB/YqeY domain-containing protein [Pseudomonadota bacterium]